VVDETGRSRFGVYARPHPILNATRIWPSPSWMDPACRQGFREASGSFWFLPHDMAGFITEVRRRWSNKAPAFALRYVTFQYPTAGSLLTASTEDRAGERVAFGSAKRGWWWQVEFC